jgi:hypothetical protein
MMQTIALATLAYAVFVGFVLAFMAGAKRGDQISERELAPKPRLAEIEREKRRSAA